MRENSDDPLTSTGAKNKSAKNKRKNKRSRREQISIYFDGLTEPRNPGGYGTYGFVVKADGRTVRRGRGFIGKGPEITNNRCEYIALLKALEYVKENFPHAAVKCYGDSLLVINQMKGIWNVKNKALMELWLRASDIASSLPHVEFEWIPREENEEADALSREAYYDAILSSENAKKLLKKTAHEQMKIESLTKNKYRVNGKYIVNAERMTCTCPDFVRENICRHVIRILIKKKQLRG